MKNTDDFQKQFEEDVRAGLTANPKFLYSKYFYDEIGDKLFQDIMEMPEYYLTKCEYEIFQNQKEAIIDSFKIENQFDLIELGAGDGKKTKILLEFLSQKNIEFQYFPIDISQHALDDLELSLAKELPDVNVKPRQGMYFDVLKQLADYDQNKKVIVVLGSNIGNLLHPQAIEFLKSIAEAMGENDLLLMGFDQKKDPQVILDAYNDKSGITENFNKNLLRRINKEMNADFDIEEFLHWPTYNPETGTVKSFLVSKKEQFVNIEKLQLKVQFQKYESIHTEISQKYDDETVSWLASEAGLEIIEVFSDEKMYYKDYVFRRK
ncbi:MAG TPA: L-histidine N(alpha)-methyltransferase [Salinimicrobium sp.]|nr:L-histidine N(alpha)-methyltransferase [Salinimicrobium sp.]